jgi:uncharacterized membrane protein
MRRSISILVAGVVAAGLVLATGKWNTHRLEHNAEEGLNKCYAWAQAKPTELQIPSVTVCDEGWSAVQVGARSSEKWSRVTAAVIAVLGALPWAWYFLLRRIAELRAAIGGNPPAK